MNQHRRINRTSISRSLSNEAMAGGATIIFANADMTVDEKGWTLIPFGKWLHSMGWQYFGKEEATAICNAFRKSADGVVGKVRRFVLGLPIFKGHPDQPELAAEFPDDTIYGQTADLEVRENGLAIKMALGNAGAALVEQGLKFISPRWDAHPVGEKDGQTIWSPYKLLSIGLVKRPNIPNASLVNHATDFMNKAELIALLKLPADSTDEQVKTALANVAARPEASALSNAESKLTAATTELATVKTSLSNVTSERDSANQSLANERKAHRTSLVTYAIKDGRVIPADQELWLGRLANNFDAEAKTLANMAPTIKVNATAEQGLLAQLNAKLAGMTDEQRLSFSKTGILANDDGGDDMANVASLCKLVNKEMAGDAYKHIKDPNERYSKAMGNVLKIHKQFLTPDAAK